MHDQISSISIKICLTLFNVQSIWSKLYNSDLNCILLFQHDLNIVITRRSANFEAFIGSTRWSLLSPLSHSRSDYKDHAGNKSFTPEQAKRRSSVQCRLEKTFTHVCETKRFTCGTLFVLFLTVRIFLWYPTQSFVIIHLFMRQSLRTKTVYGVYVLFDGLVDETVSKGAVCGEYRKKPFEIRENWILYKFHLGASNCKQKPVNFF